MTECNGVRSVIPAALGSVLDLAIGFTVGAAFTTVAKSLVNDIVMPPVGLLLGRTNFSNLYVVLKQSTPPLSPGSPLQEAQAAGAVTINYGLFITNALALALVALVMFCFIRVVNRIDRELDEHLGEQESDTPANKKCKYCRSAIDYQAVRCPHCTSELDTAQGTAV